MTAQARFRDSAAYWLSLAAFLSMAAGIVLLAS